MRRRSAGLLATVVAVGLAAAAEFGASVRAEAGDSQIAVSMTDGRIALIDPAGRLLSTLTRKTTAGTVDSQPTWSPGGNRLAFTRTTDGGRSYRIFVMRADGSGVRPVSHGRFAASPSWSPDGRWIAYTSENGLQLVHPDGSGARAVKGTGRETPNCSEIYATYPSWTPRGKLSFSFHGETEVDWPKLCRRPHAYCGWVLTIRLDGTARAPVVHGRDAHWSPDGGSIVYTLPDGGIATIRSAGDRPHLLGRGYLASWSAEGDQVVFARLGEAAAGDSIWLMGADGSSRHRIMQGATDPAWRPS